jgi:hypothetical protein
LASAEQDVVFDLQCRREQERLARVFAGWRHRGRIGTLPRSNNRKTVRGGRNGLNSTSCWAALMRINIWIILATLLALLVITRYLQEDRDTQRICADDPSASVCQR